MLAAVVKLGGSVITDKESAEPSLRRDVVRRLAEEIGDAGLERLILVHGAGSFGHGIVHRTGIDQGLERPGGLLAWAETQRLQSVLAAEVAQVFIQVGIPAIPCQASSSAVLRAGELQSMDVNVARHILEAGGVPQFNGVPAVDLAQGCAILSGDQIAPYLAHHLQVGLVVHGTDVDGVLDRDPRDGEGKTIPLIHRHNCDRVLSAIGGARSTDVTGGMRGKVESLIRWARAGVQARIVDATQPGRVVAALSGDSVGTLVSWEEQA